MFLRRINLARENVGEVKVAKLTQTNLIRGLYHPDIHDKDL
jgi:hypothetical protein